MCSYALIETKFSEIYTWWVGRGFSVLESALVLVGSFHSWCKINNPNRFKYWGGSCSENAALIHFDH